MDDTHDHDAHAHPHIHAHSAASASTPTAATDVAVDAHVEDSDAMHNGEGKSDGNTEAMDADVPDEEPNNNKGDVGNNNGAEGASMDTDAPSAVAPVPALSTTAGGGGSSAAEDDVPARCARMVKDLESSPNPGGIIAR